MSKSNTVTNFNITLQTFIGFIIMILDVLIVMGVLEVEEATSKSGLIGGLFFSFYVIFLCFCLVTVAFILFLIQVATLRLLSPDQSEEIKESNRTLRIILGTVVLVVICSYFLWNEGAILIGFILLQVVNFILYVSCLSRVHIEI